MPRSKGTPNSPQAIIDEIMTSHANGKSVRELSIEYVKPFKTIKNMITRENNKKLKVAKEVAPRKQRGRKPAVTLAEYKYENKRLKMENELLRDFLYLVGRK